MKLNLYKLLDRFDWFIFLPMLLLIAVGLAAIYSVALGRGAGESLNFNKQLIFIAIGLIVFLVATLVNYRSWQKIGWLGYLISLLLLILVLTPLGSTVRGSRGWFDLGVFSFQPVELMKIFLIMVLADVASRYGRDVHKLRHLMLIGILALLPLALVMLQPDFGSALVLLFIWLVSFILMVKNKWQIILVIGAIALVLLSSWLFIFQDYQKDRIRTFLDPSLDPLGRGYNVQQSVIAVGSGGIFGKGLSFGSQSQLKFIPESQTDFIFSVIAEELGLIGVVFVLAFFALIFYRIYKIAARAPDDFSLFFCLLALALLFIHIFINIGMCIGLLPVTGISLPLVSYGGSFLAVILVIMGIIVNINKNRIFYR
jgi:rod shape determining protein RodA